MGANSKQGWYLFLFLIGFTFLPAGLAYLGSIFSLIGLVCLVASLVGFYRIKPLEHAGSPELAMVPPQPRPSRNALSGHGESINQYGQEESLMRVLGLLIAVFGWLIAVSSVEFSSVGLQMLVALLGLAVALGGVVGVLNGSHLKNAIWKS